MIADIDKMITWKQQAWKRKRDMETKDMNFGLGIWALLYRQDHKRGGGGDWIFLLHWYLNLFLLILMANIYFGIYGF